MKDPIQDKRRYKFVAPVAKYETLEKVVCWIPTEFSQDFSIFVTKDFLSSFGLDELASNFSARALTTAWFLIFYTHMDVQQVV